MVSAASMQRPSELSKRFDISKLIGHFVVGRSVPIEPPRWLRRESDGWILLHEPSLPVHELLDSAGVEIGWILGHPIDLDAKSLVAGSLRAPVRGDAGSLGPEFESWLYGFAGRFAAVVLRPQAILYPDGGCSLPVLFAPDLQCASSSPFLLSSQDGMVPDSPLADTLAVFESGGNFTLGTTPHLRADALMSNHALDLTRWRQLRTWPLAPPAPDDAHMLLERVATTLERTMSAIAVAGRPNVGFTAGGDCRTLLACSRHALHRLRFFTVAFPDDLGTTDLHTAPLLARRTGIDYRVLKWVEPSMSDVELFMYRTGCLHGEPRGRMAARSYNQLEKDVYVSSVGMEISREVGRRRFDSVDGKLDAESLLWRFDYPPHHELLRRTRDWLKALPPGISRPDTLTLFYSEMCESPWSGPLTTAYPEAYTFALYPFMQRSILDSVLRLPSAYRLSGRFRKELINARWKELLETPINQRPFGIAVRQQGRRSIGLARAGLSLQSWRRLIRRTWRDRSGQR